MYAVKMQAAYVDHLHRFAGAAVEVGFRKIWRDKSTEAVNAVSESDSVRQRHKTVLNHDENVYRLDGVWMSIGGDFSSSGPSLRN